MKLGLSFIMVCKGLLKVAEKTLIVESILALLKSLHCTDLLILFAVHFHVNKHQSIVDQIRLLLQFPVSVRILFYLSQRHFGGVLS